MERRRISFWALTVHCEYSVFPEPGVRRVGAAIPAGLEFPEPVILSHTRELTDNGPVTRAE